METKEQTLQLCVAPLMRRRRVAFNRIQSTDARAEMLAAAAYARSGSGADKKQVLSRERSNASVTLNAGLHLTSGFDSGSAA